MGRAIAATLSDITCLVNQQEKSIIINYEMTTIVTIPNENNMITSYINKHIRKVEVTQWTDAAGKLVSSEAIWVTVVLQCPTGSAKRCNFFRVFLQHSMVNINGTLVRKTYHAQKSVL